MPQLARHRFLHFFSFFLFLHSSLLYAYQRHTNNWAVLVCTSRFWFNYRHIANTLSLYRSVKRLGIPDSQIILMLADDMPCNARNTFPGKIFNSYQRNINLYGEDVEVDYRGNEVSVENFIRVLTGRHEPDVPSSRRLDTDEHSNVFIFMSGHGGNEFLKFQDFEELSSPDIADAIQEMHVKRRYNELFFMVDTCQAGTLANSLYSPNLVTIGSSKKDENSYAHHSDPEIGVSVIDRFTSATLDYLETMQIHSQKSSSSKASLQALFSSYKPSELYSNPEYRTVNLTRSLEAIPLTDFLGSVLEVEISSGIYPLVGSTRTTTDVKQTENYHPKVHRMAKMDQSPSHEVHNHFQGFSFKYMVGWFLLIGVVLVFSHVI